MHPANDLTPRLLEQAVESGLVGTAYRRIANVRLPDPAVEQVLTANAHYLLDNLATHEVEGLIGRAQAAHAYRVVEYFRQIQGLTIFDFEFLTDQCLWTDPFKKSSTLTAGTDAGGLFRNSVETAHFDDPRQLPIDVLTYLTGLAASVWHKPPLPHIADAKAAVFGKAVIGNASILDVMAGITWDALAEDDDKAEIRQLLAVMDDADGTAQDRIRDYFALATALDKSRGVK